MKLTATSFNIRERIAQTIARIQQMNTQQQEATIWERNPEYCEFCGLPMSKRIFGEGYFCSPCEQASAEAQKQRIESGKMQALFPYPGDLRRATMTPGTYTRNVRHAMQEDAARGFIAAFTTHKELRDTPEISLLTTLKPQKPPTTPLPARDIERANTPLSIETLPTSPLPPLIAHTNMFDDDELLSLGMTPLDEDEHTEVRQRTPHTSETKRIPAITAEILLMEIMRQPTNERETGENERLSSRQSEDAFLL